MSASNPLPVQSWGFHDVPAIPRAGVIDIGQMLLKLNTRARETDKAMEGLAIFYTIGDHETTAKEFMYGKSRPSIFFAPQFETDIEASAPAEQSPAAPPAWDTSATARNELLETINTDPDQIRQMLEDEAYFRSETVLPPPAAEFGSSGADETGVDESLPEAQALALFGGRDPLTNLSLTAPEQFAMPWTTYHDIYQAGRAERLSTWVATLTDIDAATQQFWPTIAHFGLAYNLLILKKVAAAETESLREKFGAVWTNDLAAQATQGRLYVIDLSIFSTLEPQTVNGLTRFTPATLTLLVQDPVTKELTPVAVRVSGQNDGNAQVYVRGEATDSAWLYALQAAKTSITVYGIWLGHVYHWHIVTAAMLMDLDTLFPPTHPIYQLLAPQSDYLITFDTILLILWSKIAPPTSIASRMQFIELINTFAKGRTYFDDDPRQTLEILNVTEQDFSVDTAWDRYPIAGRYLEIWEEVARYVDIFVDASYHSDGDVAADGPLQKWLRAAADPHRGNVRGLPEVDGKDPLKKLLTSLIYRLTVHGASRLSPVANPGLTFVANFPPCLQDTTIPSPDSDFDTKSLLKYLPTTGVLGEIATFYFTFAFSSPYRPLIPSGGADQELFFPGGLTDPRNQALIALRESLISFMQDLYGQGQTPAIGQWPMNIET
jgi:hypothetical protein